MNPNPSSYHTSPDFALLLDDCLRHLQALIRLDTANPPGNEILAARYVASQLEAAGVEYEIVEPAPGRANLRAVLKGDGSARPLLLMSHMDVVPAEPEYWSRPPFSGEVVDGYVWGRGAVDMKQWVAWHLTIFLWLARENVPLKRDVALLATADEEDGSYMGMRWIAEHKAGWLDAEYGLSEGSGGALEVGDRSFIPCRVAEKGACRFHLRAHGSPGHASRPHDDNAIVKLGRALGRLGSNPLPLRVTLTVREMLEVMVGGVPGGADLVRDLLEPATHAQAMAAAPFNATMKGRLNAQLRNTAAPTILHPAGNRINVIPSTAMADFDGRPMPGVSIESFVEEVRTLAGSDAEIEVYESWPGSASRFDTELYGVLRDVTRDVTGLELVPFLATGASDARFAEPLGVQVYGYGPMLEEPDASPTGLMHAHDERISLRNLDLGLRCLREATLRIAAKSG